MGFSSSKVAIGLSLLLWGSLAFSANNQKETQESKCGRLLSGVFQVGQRPTREYLGVAKGGMAKVNQLAEDFQHNEAAFNRAIVGQESIFQIHMLTRVSENNHLILGPPGGAKTMGVTWAFPEAWAKLVTEWTTPFEFFGGQTKAGLENGIEEVNTKGSALEAVVVNVEEFNNANPGLNGPLMSYLNPGERSITVNGRRLKGETESVFSTGNATRAELLENYTQHQLQSGPAVLSRFYFHSLVNNWLDESEQNRLNEVYKRLRLLRRLIESGDAELKAEAEGELEELGPKSIDFDLVRSIGDYAFQEDPLLESVLNKAVSELRRRLNAETRKSEDDIKKNNGGYKFEPKADWNERTRSVLMGVIKYSAALDLLRLPTEVRENLLKQPIKLSPLSLWRMVDIAITNFVGIKFFDLPKAEMQFNIIDKTAQNSDRNKLRLGRHDLAALAQEARTELIASEFEHLALEQQIFNKVLHAQLEEIAKSDKEIASLLTISNDFDFDKNPDFEYLVYGYLWRNYSAALAAEEAAAQKTQPGDDDSSDAKPKKK